MSTYTRREFVTGVGAAGAAAYLTLAARLQAQPAAGRPNFLCFVCEDSNPRIGAYGDSLARTPTIDRLAREGIRCRNAYSTSPVCGPSRFAIMTGFHADSAAPGNAMRGMAELPAFVRGMSAYLRDAGYYCTNNAKKDYRSNLEYADIWDESSPAAHWRKRPSGKPFFAVFNTFTTHESCLFNVRDGRVKPEDVRVPAYLPDTPGVRRDVAMVYNAMEKMDGELAEHLKNLEADGLSDDTIVFYYSDHGGILPRSKRFCYDEGLRIPLVAYFPKKWAHLASVPAGSVIDAPVSLVDLAPTIFSLAGVATPDYMQGQAFLGPNAKAPRKYAFSGRNRMDERFDMIRTVTDGRYRYIRNYSPHRIWAQHGAFMWQIHSYQDCEAEKIAGRLNPTQARFWQKKPFEEFYDLEADRDQIDNAIDRPEHQARIHAMRLALDEHMLAINDNGFIPEDSPNEGYLQSRKVGAYPLRRIMEMAALAASGQPANLGRLRHALADPDDVVRYWAAQGILILGDQAKDAAPDLRKLVASDLSLHVRVVAAEALLGYSNDREAMALLKRTVENEPRVHVRLAAINALTYLGDKAREVSQGIRNASESDDEYLRGACRYLNFVFDGSYTPASPVYDNDWLKRQFPFYTIPSKP